MKIKNSRVLVTGASRGIGAALVKALLEKGAAKIYATARQSASLEGIVALAPERVVALSLDVTEANSVERLKDLAPDVNLVINNAGALEFGGILEVSPQVLEDQFATNFYGPLQVAKVLAPVLAKSGGGAIVNVLTLLSMVSAPGMSAYNASKAAAWSMTQSLRASLATQDIAVHGVFPGAVDTEMLSGVEIDKTSPEHVASAIVAGLEAGQEDIFPDPMSTAVYASWKQDHKAVERQFAAM